MLTDIELARLWANYKRWLTSHIIKGASTLGRTSHKLAIDRSEAAALHAYVRRQAGIPPRRSRGPAGVTPGPAMPGVLPGSPGGSPPDTDPLGGPAADPDPPSPYPPAGAVSREGSGIYIPAPLDGFIIQLARGLVCLSRSWVDWVAARYSGAGGNWSAQRVAQATGIDRKDITRILRLLGRTHDGEPASLVTVISTDPDRIVSDCAAIRRRELETRIRARGQAAEASDADKWRRWEIEIAPKIETWIRDSLAPAREIPPLRLSAPAAPWLMVIPTADLHWGMYAGPDTGQAYNRRIARERWTAATEVICSELLAHGRPESILAILAGDFYHVDNWEGETSHGTPQDTDGTWAEIWTSGVEAAIEHLDRLRQIAPVRAIIAQGNHDRMGSITMARTLAGHYRVFENCQIETGLTSRLYREYGASLILVHHGRDLGAGKAPAVMAAERPESWGRARFRYVLSGHWHEKMVEAYPGALALRLPSLAGPWRWMAERGLGSMPAAEGYRIDRDRGLVGSATYTLEVNA